MVPSNSSPAPFRRERRGLLARLRSTGDSVGLSDFDGIYRKMVYGLSRDAGLTRDEAEQVARDVFARIPRSLAEFESDPNRGSLFV
jgi:hypothetical protein